MKAYIDHPYDTGNIGERVRYLPRGFSSEALNICAAYLLYTSSTGPPALFQSDL
jgi:hypothetical protein